MTTGFSKTTIMRVLPLALLLALSAGASWMAPREPSHLAPELSWQPPGQACWLGCGEAGVDVMSLTAAAVMRAVGLASSVAAIGFAFGAPLGAAAAIRRGWFERAVERACDLLQAFPSFFLAVAVLSVVRSPNRYHLGAVFVVTAWAPFARLALAETRVLRKQSFVEAATALGATPMRVLMRHVLPNALGVVAVQLGSSASAVVVSEAALSFVGLGPRDGVSLGGLVDQGVVGMLRAPHVLAVGAVAVFMTSASLLVAARAVDTRSSVR